MCIHDHSSMANLGSGQAKFTYFLPIYLFYLDQTGKKPLILEDLFYYFFFYQRLHFPSSVASFRSSLKYHSGCEHNYFMLSAGWPEPALACSS